METIMYAKLIAIALVSGAVFGCDDPGRAQKAVDQAQVQADQVGMKTQGEIDRKQAAATQLLLSAQQDERGTFNGLLSDLDKRETDLKASKLTAKASDQAALDEKLHVVGSHRATIQADSKALDSPITAETWTTLKLQFDKDVSSCQTAVGKT
jgi:hypothetical protein